LGKSKVSNIQSYPVCHMKKRWIPTVVLCAMIVGAVLAGILLTGPTPEAPAFGTFFYTWYEAPGADKWNHSKYVDFPVYGNYSSNDLEVIKQQLASMQDIGIDFVIMSWHGFYDDYDTFIDNATRTVFKIAQEINSPLKLAIMVEPFNATDNYNGRYNYTEIYNYVWDNYIRPYDSMYYKQNGKPLICFFNDVRDTPGLTPNGAFQNDVRFTRLTVGQQSYAQWLHTDLDDFDRPQLDPVRQTSVTPRFDDSRLDRNQSVIKDGSYNQGIYDKEWANATRLWKEGKIDIILINSWNEYPERTAIEPHNDGTAVYPYDDPFYLYNKTKSYISEIRYQAAK
jgi:hypothetical protein